jgi:hypothetical protein
VKKRLFGTVLLILPLMLSLRALADDAIANVDGNWQVSWQGRQGTQQATLQLKQDGSNLSGTFQGPGGSSSVSGTIHGNNVSFTAQFEGSRSATLVFAGAVDGDKMIGTFQAQGGGGGGRSNRGSQGSHSWTGTRQQQQ